MLSVLYVPNICNDAVKCLKQIEIKKMIGIIIIILNCLYDNNYLGAEVELKIKNFHVCGQKGCPRVKDSKGVKISCSVSLLYEMFFGN